MGSFVETRCFAVKTPRESDDRLRGSTLVNSKAPVSLVSHRIVKERLGFPVEFEFREKDEQVEQLGLEGLFPRGFRVVRVAHIVDHLRNLPSNFQGSAVRRERISIRSGNRILPGYPMHATSKFLDVPNIWNIHGHGDVGRRST